MIASDWTGGFLNAVVLRPLAWKPLVEGDGDAAREAVWLDADDQ